MALSLYDASVGPFRQMLRSTENVLGAWRAHCERNDIAPDDILETRLIEDMLPFRYQVLAVPHHSLGALRGIEEGVFDHAAPGSGDEDLRALEELIARTRAGLDTYAPEAVNGLAGRTVQFRITGNSVPFQASSFLLSFALPSFYFHVTMTYGLLRMRGAPIGKRDFLALG